MSNKQITPEIPTLNLIASAPYHQADLNVDQALTVFKPVALLKKMGFQKRSGDSLEAIFYTMMLLPLLQLKSIHLLFSQSLPTLLNGGKDVIYDFMKNQSINWSLLLLKMSWLFCRHFKWTESKAADLKLAFVVDDTLDGRSGKKMEGASFHWDHNQNRSLWGHQLLQLGLATQLGFLPISGHLFVGHKKRSELSKTFTDKRHAVSRSYKDAHLLTKHELLAKMLKKAISFGFHAHYLLGDAWFGCKANVQLALEYDLIAIFMMKRGKINYRYKGQLYTAKALYRKYRSQMTRIKNTSFEAYSVKVDYNLSKDPKTEEWISVQLVFSRMKSAPKSSWVVLFCTDTQMTIPEILEVYSLRWNIEVYFKEIKQYFGFGKEQSWQFAAIMASIHLAMMRYLLFYYLALSHGSCTFAELRNQVSLNLKLFTYGFMAWQTIARIIAGTLAGIERVDEELAKRIQIDIHLGVAHYFQSLFPLAIGILPDDIRKLDLAEKKGEI